MRNGNNGKTNGKTRRTRNSKDKHVRDTNNYRAVAHISVNAVCVYISYLMANIKVVMLENGL